eukprot:385820_1
MNNYEQFPICLETYNNNNNINNNDEIKWYTIPKLSVHEWFMLISILYINSTVSMGETAFIIYYSIYVISDLNGNVIIGTLGIVILSISFMIGNMTVPKWINSQYEGVGIFIIFSYLKDKYKLIAISLIALIFHMIFLFPHFKSLDIYWIYDITTGFFLGILSMSSEYVILEIQPTKYSGKVSGAKGLIRNWLTAVILLLISIYWDTTHNVFYYALGLCLGISLLFTFSIMYIKNKH